MSNIKEEKISYDGVIRNVLKSETAFVTLEASSPIKKGTILMRNGDKYKPYETGSSDPVGIALNDVEETEAGDYPVGVMLSGSADINRVILKGQEAGAGITTEIKDKLRMYSIYLESYIEIGKS